MGFLQWAPQLAGVGLQGAGLLGQWLSKRRIQQFFDQPEGALEPGAVDLSAFSPEQARILGDLFGDMPGGEAHAAGLAAGEAGRIRQRGVAAGATQELRGMHDPLLDRLKMEADRPAVSQAEVDAIVGQLTSGITQGVKQRTAAAAEGGVARGLSPDTLTAIRQGLAGEGGRAIELGRMGTTQWSEGLNRQMEAHYLNQLRQATGTYGAQLMPQLGLETQLAGDTGAMGQAANLQTAMKLFEMGATEEAAALFRALITQTGASSFEFGESNRAIQAAEEAAAAPNWYDPLLQFAGPATLALLS